MAEKYKHFQRTQLGTLQIKHRKDFWCPQRRNKSEHLLLISVHTVMATTKRSTIQQKNTKFSAFVFKSVLEQLFKLFSKSAIRRNYNLKLDPHIIILLPVNNATTFTNTMKKKRSVSKFLHLCLNNIWAPFRRLVCITRISCFSSLPWPETLFRQVQDRQRAAALKTPRFFIRKNTAVNGVEHQRTINIENKNVENGIRGLQKSSKNHFVTTCKKKKQNTHKHRKIK